MAPRTLHLLRHGAPVSPGRMLGHADCAPTTAGIDACMTRARGLAIDAVVTSDLVRASVAAYAIGAELNVPVTVDPRWRELDFGRWDGLHPGEVDQAALARFWQDPDAHPPPQGEGWSALVARIGQAVSALPSCTVLVVTHGGPIRAALTRLCGIGHPAVWAFDLPYAALVSLAVWPGDPSSGQIRGLAT